MRKPHSGNLRPHADKPADLVPFAGIVAGTLAAASVSRPGSTRVVEPLAGLEYGTEITLKTAAFREFWERNRLPGQPGTVFPSPLPRGYRTTTRRRAVLVGGNVRLIFAEEETERESALEPPAHGGIYRFLLQAIRQPVYRPVAACLNYLIIRGSYTAFTVIFNVCRLNADIIRKLRSLGEKLRTAEPAAVAAFVFLDPDRSSYYLDQRRPPAGLKVKKLYGSDRITVDYAGFRYSFYPTGFSQINGAMVPLLMQSVRELLAPRPEQRLIDLYCGYGLFALYLAGSYAEVRGLDADPETIKAAQENAAALGVARRIVFSARRITRRTIETSLPGPGHRAEAILLDPPRQGVEPGVVEAIASRRPSVVVEAFCGVDRIPGQIRAWGAAGYRLARVLPLDLFPGTPNLEVLVALRPHPGRSV